MMSDEVAGVDVRDLTVGFGGQPVLDGASVLISGGQIAAILGPSGSGKTTLLRTIAGFVKPISGSVTIAGEVVSDQRTMVAPEKRNIGLVPQEGALFPHLNVGGNVGFGLPGRTREQRAQRKARVEQLLEFVSLPGTQNKRVHELSGGMQQRVALARALAREPRCVLLDEPFSALDSSLRKELRAQVRELLRSANATSLLVTHDEDEAAEFADAVHRIDAGRIVDELTS